MVSRLRPQRGWRHRLCGAALRAALHPRRGLRAERWDDRRGAAADGCQQGQHHLSAKKHGKMWETC